MLQDKGISLLSKATLEKKKQGNNFLSQTRVNDWDKKNERIVYGCGFATFIHDFKAQQQILFVCVLKSLKTISAFLNIIIVS